MSQPPEKKSHSVGWTIATLVGFALTSSFMRACHQQKPQSEPIQNLTLAPTPWASAPQPGGTDAGLPAASPRTTVPESVQHAASKQTSPLEQAVSPSALNPNIAEPAKITPEVNPVALPAQQLALVKGLFVKDAQGFVSVHNDSSWTIVSVDFLITVAEQDDSGRQETFRYHAVREGTDAGAPYATSRFTFEPFSSQKIVDGLHYVNPALSWQIAAATGLK